MVLKTDNLFQMFTLKDFQKPEDAIVVRAIELLQDHTEHTVDEDWLRLYARHYVWNYHSPLTLSFKHINTPLLNEWQRTQISAVEAAGDEWAAYINTIIDEVKALAPVT